LAFLAIHVAAGLTAVITGAIAALARKGSPKHIRAGRWFYRAITVVFATATILAAMRWRQDYQLFLIGAVAFTAATVGYQHRPRHPPAPTPPTPVTPAPAPQGARRPPPDPRRPAPQRPPPCRYGTGCHR